MGPGEKLQHIFLAGGRASGRTHAAVKGALETGATLLVRNESQARTLRQQFSGLKVLSMSNPDKLKGHYGAVIPDHYLLETLFNELQDQHRFEKEVLRNKREKGER